MNAGLKAGVLAKAGSWVQMGNLKLGQGQDGAKKFLKENPKVGEEIR